MDVYVLTRWLADAEILFDVPASAFVPPPKITSSIVQIVPAHPVTLVRNMP